MVFLLRVASALVFASGLGALRVSVHLQSYALLAFGLLAATAGLAWLVLGGGMRLRPGLKSPTVP